MFSYQDKKILIVDDQKAFHVMLKTMLTNQGAKNINFADSAENAVKLAHRHEFDIYLIDYNLGSGKNGAQLIDYLRNNQLIPKTALCFIITGDNNKGMVLSAIEKSPDDYLMKPFSQTLLFNRLSKASQKKNALADIFEALHQQDYAQGITLCKEKIHSEPKFRGLCKHLLADIFIETQQYEAAERILKPLVDQRPLVRASISLGKAYYLQRKYPQAIEQLKNIIDSHPLQIEAYQWLARAYQQSDELSQALKTLTLAANLTHHSIERHQEVALLANEMHEHEIMQASYSAILQLSRNSFYPDPCHLANYIHSIIDYAVTQDDLTERKVILKQVNSALYQSRFEEGRHRDFDFNNFDNICQANVFFALDEPLKAKRKILNTLHNNETPIEEFDNTLLCESVFSLLDVGELDCVAPYLEELKQRDIIDATMRASIEKHTGETFEVRLHSFKAHNKLGIQAFAQNLYSNALSHFNKALELEPLNSGALLNRIQVYLKLLQRATGTAKVELLSNCQNSFSLLSNTRLPEVHSLRYKELRADFRDLQPRKKK